MMEAFSPDEGRRDAVAASGPSDRQAAEARMGSLTRIPIPRVETRITNQRLEDRHRGLVDSATIHFRWTELVVPVVNISSRGAMIECDLPARIGEAMEFELADGNRTGCVVRWLREGRMGLEFVNEAIVWNCSVTEEPQGGQGPAPGDTSSPDVQSERPQRRALIRMGKLYWNGAYIPVRLRNISTGGARLESDQELTPGCEVELDLGDAGYVAAQVRWSRDGNVGLSFAEQFDYEALVPAKTGEEAPKMLKPEYLKSDGSPTSPWSAMWDRFSPSDL